MIVQSRIFRDNLPGGNVGAGVADASHTVADDSLPRQHGQCKAHQHGQQPTGKALLAGFSAGRMRFRRLMKNIGHDIF